ncbi:hypothetical protein [Candidatus Odyssella thessalonicensis]|uniref:hypothetical protein n=1 Tax=Candidatus Odyssella thessalonicensis TaxID=84647 RepID=UPI000225B175|nr:hypothetical protein [Candidatus Odyssella thessalonicensis]
MLRSHSPSLYAAVFSGLLFASFPTAAMQISNVQRQELIRELAASSEKVQLDLLFQSSPCFENDMAFCHEITSAEEISSAIMLEKLLKNVDDAALFAKYFEESLVAIPEFHDFLLSSIAAVKVSPPLTAILTKKEMELCAVKVNFLFLSKFMLSYNLIDNSANKSRLARAFSKMYFVSLINLMYTQSNHTQESTYFPHCIESYKVRSMGLVNFLLKSKNIERAFSYLWHHNISHESLAGSDYIQIIHALRSDYHQYHTYFIQQIKAQVYVITYSKRKRGQIGFSSQENVSSEKWDSSPKRKRRASSLESLENSSPASTSPTSSAGPSSPLSFSGSSSPISSSPASFSLNSSPISLPLTPDNYNKEDLIFHQPFNANSVEYASLTQTAIATAPNGVILTEVMPGIIEIKYKEVVFYYNQRSKYRFFGDPVQAKPASDLQLDNMQVIFKYLYDLYCKKYIKENRFIVVRSCLGIINTAIKENVQICHDLFSQFKATGLAELQYSLEPSIIINCEEVRERVQDRAHAIYIELIECFQLALENDLLVKFFTQAFKQNRAQNYRLVSIRKDLEAWKETIKYLLQKRATKATELAYKQETSTAIAQSFTKIIEKIKHTRPLKIFDYQTYETYLDQPGLPLPPKESHKLEADKKFYAEIASEVKGRVFEEAVALSLDITAKDIDTYWLQYCKIK